LTTRYQHGRSITARQLQQQRNEFWATRVDGNSQSWLALKNVSEAFLGGDIELANALLEASMITTPNGSLDLCYDERGHQYKVPMYCFADPVELLADGGSSSSSGGSSSSSSSSSGGSANGGNKNGGGGGGGSGGWKGSFLGSGSATAAAAAAAPAAPVVDIKCRVRINPGDYTLLLDAKSNDTIRDFKTLVKEQAKQHEDLVRLNVSMDEWRQRIIYKGFEQKDDGKTLLAVGVCDESTVVQIFLRPQNK